MGYGLTEATRIGASTDSLEESRRYGTAGLLSPSTEAKIVDSETGEVFPINRTGELWLRGPTIMKGYFSNQEATTSTLNSEGWLRTGDICYNDNDGYIFIVDRLKELIKYKGYQVPAAEQMALLLTHFEPVNTCEGSQEFVRDGSPLSKETASLASEASAIVIDGKSVAKQIRDEITAEVSRMKEAIGVIPGLAVIFVGDRKDSATYVRNKKKACESAGINSLEVHLPEDSTEQEVLNYISSFNDDPSVHGILIQLPLPSHMNEQNILNAVKIEKDVDGFHPLNIGRLAMRGREPLFVPCTPKGCIELLHRYGVSIKGKKAVVIGRSNIVGMPAALLLQREDATLSVVHSKTSNPEEITRQADIIITAAGQPNMVRGSWIKPGAVIIDVGINPVEDPNSPRGYRLVGDVCYEEACKVASAITPVPGGVGPMTIAMLLQNTLSSAKRMHNFQ